MISFLKFIFHLLFIKRILFNNSHIIFFEYINIDTYMYDIFYHLLLFW